MNTIDLAKMELKLHEQMADNDYTEVMTEEKVTLDSQRPLLVIVDDEAPILSSLSRELHGVDADIKTFESPLEALEFCKNHSPEMVLSDSLMPELEGSKFLAEIADLHPLCERVLLTGHTDSQSAINAINKGRIHYYLEKPWNRERLLRVVNKGIEAAVLRERNQELEALTTKQNQQLKEWNNKLETLVESRTQRLKDTQAHTLSTFANLIEQRLPGRTSSRVIADLALKIAEHLGLSKPQHQALKYAALLRNIGKIGMSDDLLNTPYYAMNAAQRSEFRQHPSIGAVTLAGLKAVNSSVEIISQHCENFDGSGYPNHLKSVQINTASQILAIACAYYDGLDGLLWEKPQSEKQMLEWLESQKNQLFCIEIAQAAISVITVMIERQQDNQHPDAALNVMALQSGMVLSRDLESPSGVLLLSKGTELNNELIQHLLQLEKNGIGSLDLFIAN